MITVHHWFVKLFDLCIAICDDSLLRDFLLDDNGPGIFEAAVAPLTGGVFVPPPTRGDGDPAEVLPVAAGMFLFTRIDE